MSSSGGSESETEDIPRSVAGGNAAKNHSKKQEKEKSSTNKHWESSEVKMLIAIWSEPEIAARISSKKSKGVYAEIAGKLAEMGVVRTKVEVHTKIRNLTAAYKKENLRLESTGESGDIKLKFYNELNELLASRVSVNPVAKHDSSAAQFNIAEKGEMLTKGAEANGESDDSKDRDEELNKPNGAKLKQKTDGKKGRFSSGYAPPSKRKANSMLTAALEKIDEGHRSIQLVLAQEMAKTRESIATPAMPPAVGYYGQFGSPATGFGPHDCPHGFNVPVGYYRQPQQALPAQQARAQALPAQQPSHDDSAAVHQVRRQDTGPSSHQGVSAQMSSFQQDHQLPQGPSSRESMQQQYYNFCEGSLSQGYFDYTGPL